MDQSDCRICHRSMTVIRVFTWHRQQCGHYVSKWSPMLTKCCKSKGAVISYGMRGVPPKRSQNAIGDVANHPVNVLYDSATSPLNVAHDFATPPCILWSHIYDRLIMYTHIVVNTAITSMKITYLGVVIFLWEGDPQKVRVGSWLWTMV